MMFVVALDLPNQMFSFNQGGDTIIILYKINGDCKNALLNSVLLHIAHDSYDLCGYYVGKCDHIVPLFSIFITL